MAKAGPDKVAVYLAGFEEVADVLSTARTVTGLDRLRWYGGDASAQTKALLASGPATFATKARVNGYPSPLVALPADQAKKEAELLRQISKRAKVPADAFTLAAYDAFNAAARALADTPADADAASLRAAFAAQAEGAKGVTGTIRLDAAGDRVSTPYAFWSICHREDEDPEWRDTGRWTPAADPVAPGRVQVKECPKE
jgi:branched-chain amino acid transport system substrate-binding protein